MPPPGTADPAFLFDLDGTLIDSVYQHVLAWHRALSAEGIEVSIWRIHRRIGMSGGLFAAALFRETGRAFDTDTAERLRHRHAEAHGELGGTIRALPGARDLLEYLTETGVKWAVATSGRLETARPALDLLGIDPDRVPFVTRDLVANAKPNPDLFLEAARRLDVDPRDAVVVGDSVWDLLAARRARSLGIGLLSGGYGESELLAAGAYRVYEDPADMLAHIHEIGLRASRGG